MEINKRLVMTFKTTDDKKVSLSVDDPREDITESEIKSAMDLVVAKNIFAPNGADIASIVEAKVVVTGYADKGTGNDRVNDRIAAKRAAAVVWMLEKRYGIPAERITEESKGARVQPFAENDKNRVSIMIAK